jgi:hypothetical protein
VKVDLPFPEAASPNCRISSKYSEDIIETLGEGRIAHLAFEILKFNNGLELKNKCRRFPQMNTFLLVIM